MPVKIHGKMFPNHDQAASYVMRWKKISKDRADAYVATVERAQKGHGKPKRKSR